MKANELRVGNLTFFKEKERELNLWDFSTYMQTNIKYYKPIPLTEEWLERLNWNPPKDMRRCKNHVWRKDFLNGGKKCQVGVSFSLTTDEIHFVVGNYYKKIKYVHQLQNLYFALTGEELQTDETKKKVK
jgi:hypothetical protein